MDWTPRDPREAALADSLLGLSRRLGERPWPVPVWGVGVVVTFGRLHPLVLVGDEMLAKVYATPPPGIHSAEDLEAVLAAGTELMLGQGVFQEAELPEGTRLLPVGRPEPLAAQPGIASGQAIRCASTHERGTAGLPVERVDDLGRTREGFLTAGHAAPNGVGSAMEAIHIRRLLPAVHVAVGTVGLHADPIGTGVAGHDVAVVDNGPGLPVVAGPARGGVAGLSALLSQPVAVDVYGGVSGTVPGALVGALMDAGDPAKRRWKDCWLLLPSGVTARGDSGAATILDQGGDVTGMVVGGSRFTAGAQAPIVQYAHDMESLERDYLTPNSVRLV